MLDHIVQMSDKQTKKDKRNSEVQSKGDDSKSQNQQAPEFVENPKVEVTAESEQEVSKENRAGLLSILTKAIGFDVTAITLPVTLNEPISFLMRLCEQMQYSELLDKAAQLDDPIQRLLHVTVFAISCYTVAERVGKPFNPVLGETYEYVDKKRNNFKFLAEQVSHHPPIGACHAEADGWQFYQSQRLTTKFAGNRLDCQALGTNNVILPRFDERFKWEAVKTSVHNVVVGKVWMDHYGELTIRNLKTGDKAVIQFKQCGWFGKNWHEIEGQLYDSKGNPCLNLWGKWNESVFGKLNDNYKLPEVDDSETSPASSEPASKKDQKKAKKDAKKQEENRKKAQKEAIKQLKKKMSSDEPIWVNSITRMTPEEYKCKYVNDWTKVTLDLTNITPLMRDTLPESDSRLRGDRIALQKEDSKTAASEKHRIEEKQRAERRQREKEGKTWNPTWFDALQDEESKDYWKYKGGYWEQREKKLKEYYEQHKEEVDNMSNKTEEEDTGSLSLQDD